MTLHQKTLHEKIGQMLLFGWKTDAQAAALITEFAAGGVILMGRNITTPICKVSQPKKICRRCL